MNELGAAVRRLVGRQPVRLRYQTQEQRFLLQDVHDDARVAALVRDKSTLQLCGPVDAAPLVLDVDALVESGGPATSEPLSTARLQAAAHVVGEVLYNAFGLRVSWFGSGKQGLHGWAFGVQIGSHDRAWIAEHVLPVSNSQLEDGPLLAFYEEHASAAVNVGVAFLMGHAASVNLVNLSLIHI